MKSMLRNVNDHGKLYNCLAFVCPGCVEMFGGTGLHMLPVNTNVVKTAWTWNGNLVCPTLTPSILTEKDTPNICHCFLTEGVFNFLSDSKHSLAGKKIPLPDLPDWFIKETNDAF